MVFGQTERQLVLGKLFRIKPNLFYSKGKAFHLQSESQDYFLCETEWLVVKEPASALIFR